MEFRDSEHALTQSGRLRVESVACVSMLTRNDKPTAGQGRRLSLLSSSSRAFRFHIFLHRLIAGKRDVARESARCRSMAQTIGLDMSGTLRR